MRILHLFKWSLKDIINHLDSISKQGFHAIQLSPIQPCKLSSQSDDWWKLYQPYDFDIGNALGSKEDLLQLCSLAKSYNLKIFADVVLNHVANDDKSHLLPNSKVSSKITCNESFFKEKRMVYNWEDRYEVTNLCIGLPSLDLSNSDLQSMVFDFLKELSLCGVSGFRIDAAKHMRLPEENSNFFIRLSELFSDKFIYAEVIFSDKSITDLYSKYVHVLTDAQTGDVSRTVSYIDSHDLEKEFRVTADTSSREILQSYYNLCKTYDKTVFYAREFQSIWQNHLVRLAHIYPINPSV